MESGSQGGWIGEGGSEAREHALHTGRWTRGADYAVGKGQGDQGLLAADVEGPWSASCAPCSAGWQRMIMLKAKELSLHSEGGPKG